MFCICLCNMHSQSLYIAYLSVLTLHFTKSDIPPLDHPILCCAIISNVRLDIVQESHQRTDIFLRNIRTGDVMDNSLANKGSF